MEKCFNNQIGYSVRCSMQITFHFLSPTKSVSWNEYQFVICQRIRFASSNFLESIVLVGTRNEVWFYRDVFWKKNVLKSSFCFPFRSLKPWQMVLSGLKMVFGTNTQEGHKIFAYSCASSSYQPPNDSRNWVICFLSTIRERLPNIVQCISIESLCLIGLLE